MKPNDNNTLIIAALNDALRRTFSGGRVMITQGVRALSATHYAALMQAVVSFNTFTPENDPYGEHDFGKITMNAQDFFWKIDYYDHSLSYGSENPIDPSITTRVLTIMLADEY